MDDRKGMVKLTQNLGEILPHFSGKAIGFGMVFGGLEGREVVIFFADCRRYRSAYRHFKSCASADSATPAFNVFNRFRQSFREFPLNFPTISPILGQTGIGILKGLFAWAGKYQRNRRGAIIPFIRLTRLS